MILLGGTDALSSSVEEDLRGLGFASEDIARIGGVSRYETAAMIAENLNATDAFVAKGDDPDADGWPDALAASAVAALLERPILLTPPGDLAGATDALLARSDIESVDIVGGVEAVSDEVERAIRAGRRGRTRRGRGPLRDRAGDGAICARGRGRPHGAVFGHR